MNTWKEHCGFTLTDVNYEERSITMHKNDGSEAVKFSFDSIHDINRLTTGKGKWDWRKMHPRITNKYKKRVSQIRDHINKFPHMWVICYKLGDLGYFLSSPYYNRQEAREAQKTASLDGKIIKYTLTP